MYGIFITVVILSTILFSTAVNSFGKRRCRKERITKDYDNKNFDNVLTDSNDECIDPYRSCGSVGFGIVKKIHYLPIASSRVTVDIKFSSACIRCGLCLAVAEQINRTLIDTHDIIKYHQSLSQSETHSLMESICDHAFRHYSLREIAGKRYICDRIPGAKLVTSTADGLWEKNLKNKCTAYVAGVGPLKLYKHWKRWNEFDRRSADLSTILCRGDEGIFRDCRSIPNIFQPESKKAESFFPKIGVMVEFKCK